MANRTIKFSQTPHLHCEESSIIEISLTEFEQALTQHHEISEKSRMPLWSPHVNTRGTRFGEHCTEFDVVVVDLDNDKSMSLEQSMGMFARIDKSGLAYIVHETYTRGRYRLVVPLAETYPVAAYDALVQAVVDMFEIPEFDDKSSLSIGRFYYLPSKPPGEDRLFASNIDGALWAPTAVPRGDMEVYQQVREKAATLKDKATREGVIQWCNGSFDFKKGSRDDTLHKVMYALAMVLPNPTPYADVADRTNRAVRGIETSGDEDTAHWARKAARAYERGLAERMVRVGHADILKAAFARGMPAVPKPVAEEWQKKLVVRTDPKTGEAKLMAHSVNVSLILENDPEFKGTVKFDALRKRVQVKNSPIDPDGVLGLDTFHTKLSQYLMLSPYKFNVSSAICAEAIIQTALDHSFEPVQEYLRSLKWDGVPRVDRVLTDICKAQGGIHVEKYHALVSSKFLIGAVARAMQPGCQHDTALVLQGNQGAGKTSFGRILSKGWGVETKLDVNSKDSVMVASANWIVELSEMASLKRADTEAVRSFLSTPEDQIRLPYGRNVVSFPRRSVFFATTNSRKPLRDPEGSRRFWVVSVGRVDRERLAAEADQIWAEAVVRYHAGEKWYLSPDEQKISDNENSVYQEDNRFEVPVIEFTIQAQSSVKPKEYYTPREVCIAISPDPARIKEADVEAVRHQMELLGWTAKRIRPTIAGRQASRVVYVKPWEPLAPLYQSPIED